MDRARFGAPHFVGSAPRTLHSARRETVRGADRTLIAHGDSGTGPSADRANTFVRSWLLSPLCFLWLLLISATGAFCQGKEEVPPPPIYVSPVAVQPGAGVAITFHDPALGKPLGVWTSFASESALLPRRGKEGQASFQITAPAHLPVGIYAARAMTSTGISHVQLLMADDLPTLKRIAGNSSIQAAQYVTLPIAIEAAAEPVSADYYRLAAKAGQRISAEVVAQRIGSPMDPMIRLLDSAGRELVYCDDSPGAGSDCRFIYSFPTDGDYYIEVRDVNYDGGPAYRYRLRLGDFPLVTMVSPLGGMRGKKAEFHLIGPGCEQLDKISTTLPLDEPRAWLNVKYPNGNGSALAAALCTDIPEQLESGPNDTPATTSAVSVPIAITGQLAKPGAVHFFRFPAKSGQRISIRGLTRAVESPAILSLRLLDADGKSVGDSNVNEAAAKRAITPPGASIDATIPADGEYRIAVRELAGEGGPGMFFRLEIRRADPVSGFSLSADSETLNIVAGKSTKFRLAVARRNYTGPIALSLTGDCSELEIVNPIVPNGRNEAVLEIRSLRDGISSMPLNIGIIGKATIDNHEVVERASTATALKRLFPRMPFPPPELEGKIGVGIVHGD